MAMVDFKLGDVGNIFTSIREAITGDKIKDPVEMAKIDLQLQTLEQASRDGQISINKIEAAHKNLFVAGWRPFIGWVCGVAIAYAFIGQPIFEWVVALNGWGEETVAMIHGEKVTYPGVTVPQIDVGVLYNLVIAMLGMAGLRTYEKKQNVSREQ